MTVVVQQCSSYKAHIGMYARANCKTEKHPSVLHLSAIFVQNLSAMLKIPVRMSFLNSSSQHYPRSLMCPSYCFVARRGAKKANGVCRQ